MLPVQDRAPTSPYLFPDGAFERWKMMRLVKPIHLCEWFTGPIATQFQHMLGGIANPFGHCSVVKIQVIPRRAVPPGYVHSIDFWTSTHGKGMASRSIEVAQRLVDRLYPNAFGEAKLNSAISIPCSFSILFYVPVEENLTTIGIDGRVARFIGKLLENI